MNITQLLNTLALRAPRSVDARPEKHASTRFIEHTRLEISDKILADVQRDRHEAVEKKEVVEELDDEVRHQVGVLHQHLQSKRSGWARRKFRRLSRVETKSGDCTLHLDSMKRKRHDRNRRVCWSKNIVEILKNILETSKRPRRRKAACRLTSVRKSS